MLLIWQVRGVHGKLLFFLMFINSKITVPCFEGTVLILNA